MGSIFIRRPLHFRSPRPRAVLRRRRRKWRDQVGHGVLRPLARAGQGASGLLMVELLRRGFEELVCLFGLRSERVRGLRFRVLAQGGGRTGWVKDLKRPFDPYSTFDSCIRRLYSTFDAWHSTQGLDQRPLWAAWGIQSRVVSGHRWSRWTPSCPIRICLLSGSQSKWQRQPSVAVELLPIRRWRHME